MTPPALPSPSCSPPAGSVPVCCVCLAWLGPGVCGWQPKAAAARRHVTPALPSPTRARSRAGWVFPKYDHVAVGTGTVVNKTAIKQYQQATRDRSKVKTEGGKIIR